MLADPERYGLKVFSKNGDTQGNGRKKPDKTGTKVPVAGEVVEGKLMLRSSHARLGRIVYIVYKTGTMVPVSEGNLPSPVWWTGFEPPVFCDVCHEPLMRALEEYGLVPGNRNHGSGF